MRGGIGEDNKKAGELEQRGKRNLENGKNINERQQKKKRRGGGGGGNIENLETRETDGIPIESFFVGRRRCLTHLCHNIFIILS